jgi:hypothetical protein
MFQVGKEPSRQAHKVLRCLVNQFYQLNRCRVPVFQFVCSKLQNCHKPFQLVCHELVKIFLILLRCRNMSIMFFLDIFIISKYFILVHWVHNYVYNVFSRYFGAFETFFTH